VASSRPAWLVADLVLLALFALAIWSIVGPLALAQAPLALRNVLVGVALAAAAALLAAGLAQVSLGRADAARGNRARFAVFWTLLWLTAGVAAAYVRWLRSPSPSDLLTASLEAAPARGTWIAVRGRARGRGDFSASLFYDLASGGFARARVSREGAVVFSEDGTAAAWTEPSGLDRLASQDIWVCRFEAGGIRRFPTPISTRVWILAMSSNGSRLAAIEEKTIAVYDVVSGRLVASAALDPRNSYLRAVFLEDERVRVYRIGPVPAAKTGEPSSVSIGVLDFDLRARTFRQAGSVESVRRPFSLAFDDRGERLIVWERGGAVFLFDIATGARLAELAREGFEQGSRAFLSDGRPILSEAANGIGRVHLFSKEGRPERVFEVGRAGQVRLGGQPAKGRITLAIGPNPEVWGASDAYLLNLESGALEKLGNHLFPVASGMRWRVPQPDPGSEVTRLFSREDGALVRLDPATGRLENLFPGR